MSRRPTKTGSAETDHPPILGTWNRFYALVLISHALLIFLFYLITKWYS